MARLNPFLLLPFCAAVVVLPGGNARAAESGPPPPALLTERQAERMAAAEARERAERDAARRRALESVPAKEEWELEQGGRTILVRRVAPPDGASETAAAGAAAEQRPTGTEGRETENPARRSDRAEPVHVDFRATVYLHSGEAVGSEVIFGRAGAAHRFWTNLDFRLPQVVGSFGPSVSDL